MSKLLPPVSLFRGPITPPPAFSPADIPDLKLWLDASTLVLSDGDPVSSWTDLSGNGNHAVQANALKQPTFKTGGGLDPTVRFDASAQTVLVAPTPVSPPCACFVVCRPYGGSQISYAIYVLTSGVWISTKLSGSNWGSFLASSGEQDSGEVLADGTPTLLEQTCNGFDTILYREGVHKITSFDVVASGALTDIQIGADDGASRWVNADISEIALYGSVPSSMDRGLLEGYASAKWL